MRHSANRPIRFAVVAGETSGDALGAGLVSALRARFPGAEFAGVCGPAIRAAASRPGPTPANSGDGPCRSARASAAAAALAQNAARANPRVETGRVHRHRRARFQPRPRTLAQAPRRAHRALRRPGRWPGANRARRSAPAPTACCACSRWNRRSTRATAWMRCSSAIRSPTRSCSIPTTPPRAALGIPVHDLVLALLPGSRLAKSNACCRCSSTQPMASPRNSPICACWFPPRTRSAVAPSSMRFPGPWPQPPLLVLDGDAQRAMIASDVVLLASGTAALEAMLCKRPMVVGHRIAPMTHAIVRGLGLLKSRFVSLPNIPLAKHWCRNCCRTTAPRRNWRDAVLAWLRDPEAAIAAPALPRAARNPAPRRLRAPRCGRGIAGTGNREQEQGSGRDRDGCAIGRFPVPHSQFPASRRRRRRGRARPLAGPVAVAAVILDPARPIAGLDDSKKLTERRRDALFPLIRERALAWRIEFVEADGSMRSTSYKPR